MVNKIIFNINTSFDGTANYNIYNATGCTGTIIYSGTTQVTNGIGNVVIDNVELVENISINVIDSNGCEICSNFLIENNVICTPFNGTAIYIQPELVTYYVLNACDESQPPYSTLLVPDGIGQRYILPGSTNYFYTWAGVESNSNTIFNGSIQKIEGEFNCPA